MKRGMLLGLLLLLPADAARAQWGWGGWGGGVNTAQSSYMRGAGVAAAGAGYYNEQTAEARAINANTAMQVNQYMFEVNKENARTYYARSAATQKEDSAVGEKNYNRLHDDPSAHDVHTGDALNVVLDELTNPVVYGKSLSAATQAIDPQLVTNVVFSYAANMVAISLADLSASGVPDYLLTTPEYANDRATIKGLVGKVRKSIADGGQPDPQTLAQLRAAIKTLKDKVDAALPSSSPQRLESDNFLKALTGLTKMISRPQVAEYLTDLKKVKSTTLGHLISFMHTFNLRFGAAKTPEQEQAYDQIFPLLVAVRDQIKAPSANPYTTSGTSRDPRTITQYYSRLQTDPAQGAAPPPPQPDNRP